MPERSARPVSQLWQFLFEQIDRLSETLILSERWNMYPDPDPTRNGAGHVV